MAGPHRGRRLALAAGATLAAALLWLAAWPVPIEPVAWQPPSNPGHADPYGGDDRLRALERIPLGDHEGPEDTAIGPEGRLYLSTAGGAILVFGRDGRPAVFADAGGRPLGIDFADDGTLWVANALRGLQRIAADGSVDTVLTEVAGAPIVYPDDVAVAADGRVFLSDATTRFAPGEFSGTYGASLLDIMEHGSTGRVVEFDPATGTARIFAAALSFANGVAVSRDQRWLLVAETAAYRIWRYPLGGGARELVMEGLPDFPDNLNNGLNDRIWVGLIAPRNPLLDRLAGRPWLRKVVQRLPQALRPDAEPHSHVIAINPDGDVLMTLEDPSTALPAITGAVETRDALYLTSLFGNAAGRLAKAALAPH